MPLVVAAVEFTVSVLADVTVPVTLTFAGTEHVTGLVAPDGAEVTVQLRFTTPAKPFAGVTEIVEVFPVVLPAEILRAPADIENVAGFIEIAVVLVDPL